MILHGNARGGASDLARHLLRDDENDHVHVLQVQGFASDDVAGAFQEIQAIASGTRCKKYLFSLSLSPPENAGVSEEQFYEAIDRAEAALGLTGQPRVIVLHEKGDNRDRHAHAVWSRVNADEMKAIPMPFNRMRMKDVSRDLFIQHGWDIPRGLINARERNPLNYTFEQYQQAKRQGQNARAIKAAIQDAWALSDNRTSFEHALEDRGFRLAKGDRRGFVAVDSEGEIYSIPKWVGIKTKAVRERLGKETDLPNVEHTKSKIAEQMLGKIDEHAAEIKRRNEERKAQRTLQRRAMVVRQRAERAEAMKTIEERQIAEATARQAKFRNGLKGVWDWMRGENKRIKAENEEEAAKAFERDRLEREALVSRQRQQRQWLALRQREHSARLREQYAYVTADREIYAEMKNASLDEKREAFRRERSESQSRARLRRGQDREPSVE